MRRTTGNARKLTAKKSLGFIDKASDNAKISIEDCVAELKERLDFIEERLYAEGILLHVESEEPEKRKPGPPQKITDAALFDLRLQLVLWLETVWPEINLEIRKASSKEQLIAVLERFCNPQGSRREYERRIIENTDTLLDFLRSKRFTRTPPKQTVTKALTGGYDEVTWRAASRFPTRQIANAMAGVPDIDWRTSMDRCGGDLLDRPVGIRTCEYYRKLLGLPAFYIWETEFKPVGGPYYTSKKAKTVADDLRKKGKDVSVGSEPDLMVMGRTAEETFNKATGMLPVKGPRE